MTLINGRISRDKEFYKEGVSNVIEVFGRIINEMEQELKDMI